MGDKRAFTMVELIFVIVILGILAAVGVSKLSATRTDAEIVKLVANLNGLINDVQSYYATQHKAADSLKAMTNVGFERIDDYTGHLLSFGKKCVKIGFIETTANKPAHLKISDGDDKETSICTKILTSKPLAEFKNMDFKYNLESGGGLASGTTSPKGEILVEPQAIVVW
ncbi:type II secretion system protein [Campylobacter gastrosuis]|uniref:Type II secretion system GspH family protein n=1 Tax=Campylobacter gastrosuis TaxID=2974576 RepID=A0ABT7HSV3_9BACT|nr:type II secretion system protein [Campylobacter gastrosuis]MDL0089780.1 type II secretion system GspH family protein [Campylobacter gastrosuis]